MAGHDGSDSVESCQLVFWRGYVKCAFYAVLEGGDPVGSPFFRSRECSPLPSGAALAAHQALVARLTEEGWEPASHGRTWYSLTFRRRDWSPIEELPLEEASAPVPAVEAHSASTVQPELQPAHDPTSVADPDPIPLATPAPAALRHGRGLRGLLIATAALIALSVGLGLTLFRTNSAQGNDRSELAPRQSLSRLRTQYHVPTPASVQRPTKAPTTKIVVTGTRGDSWVEARLGSEVGRSLYAGVVVQGQTIHVTAPVVWITFGAAGNLDLRVNGRAPVPGTFNGTVTALIAHGRVRSA